MMDTEQVKLNQTRSILSNLQMKIDGQMRVDENRLKVISTIMYYMLLLD